MNIYFLVEGKTERKVYPKWLSYLIPKLERVSEPSAITNNTYYLISGNGFPSILDNHLVASVDDVNTIGNFNFLVLVIDTDDMTSEKKIVEVEQFIKENNIILSNCKLIIIPQVVCMETWFLGNRKIYTRTPPNAECASYSNHYDTSKYDPELMVKPNNYNETNAVFHFNYLKTMLKAKNIRYSKSNPREVHKPHYIEELKNRTNLDIKSLNSMQILFSFFDSITNQMN
ncbi:hypothetical protein QUF74_09800 [Candidatus Halobeggiatoa sp. HSG11]|nr:hypothetical protein [Candidatus Halobeggiatoa sp. HSG11]